MRRSEFLSLLASALLVPFAANAAEPFPLAPAVECSPRGGLPNFFAKLQRGDDVKIGYFGGSITAANGWRPKSLAYFQSLNPKAKVSEINAAIGGTGSDLGVFRLKQDVLDHKPDLIFVEFAVNDAGAPPEQIFRCMEGIVRQAWRANPECDICFVYTVMETIVQPLVDGKFQQSASAMEKIAEHYKIPSIHMALEVAKLAKEGRIEWKAPLPKTPEEKAALGNKVVFAPDSVHPHAETGHEMYLQAIVRSTDPIRAASTKPGPHAIPEPFVKDNLEHAKMIPINEVQLSSGFEWLDPAKNNLGKSFANRMPKLHRGTKPGETITFQFKGTACSIYDIIGPDCGQVIVTLDDQPANVVARFDAHCTYHRLGKFGVAANVPDAVHKVKIEIHPDQPDKAKILAQRNKTIDNPERFNGTAFYPGAILLVGDLVK